MKPGDLRIVIVVSADENYAVGLVVTLYSALKNRESVGAHFIKEDY